MEFVGILRIVSLTRCSRLGARSLQKPENLIREMIMDESGVRGLIRKMMHNGDGGIRTDCTNCNSREQLHGWLVHLFRSPGAQYIYIASLRMNAGCEHP